MCIICDNEEIGFDYLVAIGRARMFLKDAEKQLLELSKIKNIKYKATKEKASNYNKAHKKLVKIRKMISEVESLRSGNAL